MSWLQSAKQAFLRMAWPNIENPKVPLIPENIEAAIIGTRASNSGAKVTVTSALGYSPVYSAVKTISDAVARIPWHVYERFDRDGREHRRRATGHPVYYLLKTATSDNANAPMRTTSNVFIGKLLASALLYPAGYAVIHRSGSGLPHTLEWIPSWWVKPMRSADLQLHYEVMKPGMEQIRRPRHIAKADMFVLHGMSIDELDGMSIVEFARNTIGRQLSSEQYTDDFYANHAVPTGNYVHPGEMSEPAQKRFLRQVAATHGGAGNRHKVGILEEGMQWQETSVSPKDAMLIDQLKFGVPEVARFYAMPLHLLGDQSRQGYNTTEAENQSFVNMCLGNWISRLEHEANDTLFTDDTHYSEFFVDAILKANTIDRYNAYAIGIQWGILNRNEVRIMENRDPYDGGDEYLTPMNHNVGDQNSGESDSGQADNATPPPDDSPDDDETQDAQRAVIASVMARMAKRVTGSALKAASKPDTFMRWVNRIGELHSTAINEAIAPCAQLAASMTRADVDDVRAQTLSRMIEAAVNEFESVKIPGPLQRDVDFKQRVQEAGEILTRRYDELVEAMMKGETNGNQTQHAAG